MKKRLFAGLATFMAFALLFSVILTPVSQAAEDPLSIRNDSLFSIAGRVSREYIRIASPSDHGDTYRYIREWGGLRYDGYLTKKGRNRAGDYLYEGWVDVYPLSDLMKLGNEK